MSETPRTEKMRTLGRKENNTEKTRKGLLDNSQKMNTRIETRHSEMTLLPEEKHFKKSKVGFPIDSSLWDTIPPVPAPHDTLHEIVVDSHCLSPKDISFMRLKGCRVQAYNSSAHQRCCDASTSSVQLRQLLQTALSPSSSFAVHRPAAGVEEAARPQPSSVMGDAMCYADRVERRFCGDEDEEVEFFCGHQSRTAPTLLSRRTTLQTERVDSPTLLTSSTSGGGGGGGGGGDVMSKTPSLSQSCAGTLHAVSTWQFPVLGAATESPKLPALATGDGKTSAPLLQRALTLRSCIFQRAMGSFSERDILPNYMRRVGSAYAVHESLAGQAHGASLPSVHSVSGVMPHGYYSLGPRRSLQHANKQVVPVVSQLLDNANVRNLSEGRVSFSATQSLIAQRQQMDPVILARVEQRPLLLSTLFLEYTYRGIANRHKSRLVSSHIDETINENERRMLQYSEEAQQETVMHGEKLMGLTGTTNAPCLAASFTSDAIMPRRQLTEVRTWNTKTHCIDGITRCVDNEEDDLVVFVGMILMGWLEVVDLLGCGTFGQVFLCKDLRVTGLHFVPPSMIDGEDYQYWQCSHDFIPFSDPSLPPTSDPLVVVKVVKSRGLFEQQSVLEAELLILIGAQTLSDSKVDSGVVDGSEEGANGNDISHNEAADSNPPTPDPRCAGVAKVYAHGMCFGHHCIVIEHYGANLFEYIQSRDYKGLPMYHVQEIGRQILCALTLLHDTCGVVHCDIKPENILLSLDSCISSTAIVGTNVHRTAPVRSNSGLMEKSAGLSGAHSRRGEDMARVPNPSTAAVATTNTIAAAVPAVDPNPLLPASLSPLLPVPRRMHRSSNVHVPSLSVKLIDFSSSAYINECMYTYLQSRYYRAPEVILGVGYGPPIDIWSTGCLLAELLLGLPLLSGSSDYHQLCLMEEMLGELPTALLEKGKLTRQFFDMVVDEAGDGRDAAAQAGGNPLDAASASPAKRPYRLLLEEEYRARQGTPPVEWCKYFQYRTLAELVRKCPLSAEERRIALGHSPYAPDVLDPAGEQAQSPIKEILDEMMRQRFWLYDVLQKMLHGNPEERITAREALEHPFFAETPQYMFPYLPNSRS